LSLVKRCIRQSLRRCGFWAILTDSEAQSVHALLMTGQGKDAMLLLDRSAKEIGRILPSDPSASSL
jgi:hypothetical protein